MGVPRVNPSAEGPKRPGSYNLPEVLKHLTDIRAKYPSRLGPKAKIAEISGTGNIILSMKGDTPAVANIQFTGSPIRLFCLQGITPIAFTIEKAGAKGAGRFEYIINFGKDKYLPLMPGSPLFILDLKTEKGTEHAIAVTHIEGRPGWFRVECIHEKAGINILVEPILHEGNFEQMFRDNHQTLQEIMQGWQGEAGGPNIVYIQSSANPTSKDPKDQIPVMVNTAFMSKKDGRIVAKIQQGGTGDYYEMQLYWLYSEALHRNILHGMFLEPNVPEIFKKYFIYVREHLQESHIKPDSSGKVA